MRLRIRNLRLRLVSQAPFAALQGGRCHGERKARRPKGLPRTGGIQKGGHHKRTKEVRAIMQEAFEQLGGVPALVRWGTANPTEFYRLWGKMMPLEVRGAGTNGEVVVQFVSAYVRREDQPETVEAEVVQQVAEPVPAKALPSPAPKAKPTLKDIYADWQGAAVPLRCGRVGRHVGRGTG